jgi:uncharacterized protein (DUF433 family)
MDWSGCEFVEQVPARLGGAPVVKDSRVRADTLVECIDLGESVEEIAYNYDLRRADVLAVLEFAAKRELKR